MKVPSESAVTGVGYVVAWLQESLPGATAHHEHRLDGTKLSYQLTEAVSFWDCVSSMRHDDKYKSQLVDTFLELRKDPFRSPVLSTHKIGTSRSGKDLFASDVGGRRSDRRVVWQLANSTVVMLLYGTHKIYERAKRMRIAFDSKRQQVIVHELVRERNEERERPYHLGPRAAVGTLFMAWTDDEMEAFGLPIAVVKQLRRLNTEDELLELASQLGRYWERAANLLVYEHPDGPRPGTEDAPTQARDRRAGDCPASEGFEAPIVAGAAPGDSDDSDDAAAFDINGKDSATSADATTESAATAPAVTTDDIDLEACLADTRATYWFTRTEPDFLAKVIGQPIEDWMIFLHPDQRSAARRHYNGPARVRGAAGTGKTVIGLHRAAWLADSNVRTRSARQLAVFPDERSGLPVLFTTYINSLPPVFESLYHRLPGRVDTEVEFINVDKLARRICGEAGDYPKTAPREINAAYKIAFKQVVKPGTPLANGGFSKRYLQDEITKMIKGRAIDTLDEYLGIDRTGRAAPMRRARRTQVWELMQAWDGEMKRRHTVDFCDVITRALHHSRQCDTPRYCSVIVDEAQDLTLAALQFLRALVNAPDHQIDRPNGLLILGDGGQRIYPGGFTLRQAGVEVRGRTTVLTENYRNTDEIINTALAVAGDSTIEDLGERFRRGEAEVSTLRRGPRPMLVRAVGLDAQIDEIVRQIGELTASGSEYGLGDIAVLTATNSNAWAVGKRLGGHNIAYQQLKDYDGTPSNKVKVGTFFRAKGLEFKVVFLPQITRGVMPRRRKKNQSDEEYAEARDLDISQLFVAMTRARDRLVVLYDHQPSEIIQAVVDRFEAPLGG